MLNYYCQYRGEGEVREISKELAEEMLRGWWRAEYLAEIFSNNKRFRLYTPYVEVWTNDNGLVPMAGYYGTIE